MCMTLAAQSITSLNPASSRSCSRDKPRQLVAMASQCYMAQDNCGSEQRDPGVGFWMEESQSRIKQVHTAQQGRLQVSQEEP